MEIIRNDYQVVPLKLSQEEYDSIESLSGCNYTPDQIAMYLDVDVFEFKRQLVNTESLVYFHYNRGILVSQFEISSKLLDNAKSGNITAVEVLMKRQESVNLHNLKKKFFNNGY